MSSLPYSCRVLLLASACFLTLNNSAAVGQAPDPVKNSDSPILLDLPGSGTAEEKIDYDKLPVLKGTHAIVSPQDETWKFQLHSYLIHHDGRFWCMWSHGPAEDTPPQHIRYATSADGIKWSEAKELVGPPKGDYAYIARGFWPRDGELLALVSHFKGRGAFGVDKELTLQAFAWNNAEAAWKSKGLIYDNAINSYPPQKLATGDWMMTRRDARFNVSMLIGGVKSIDSWQNVFVTDFFKNKVFRPDEPIWWPLDDKNLAAVFRDNGGSSRLFRSFSTNLGQSWSSPVKTNFPNATSKVFSMPTSAGYRILCSNANPRVGRRQLFLSTSDDGLIYTRMMLLGIPSAKPATLQYPHVLEHDGFLYIVYSRNKAMIEILRVSLQEIATARRDGES